jgi:hypothetical protein
MLLKNMPTKHRRFRRWRNTLSTKSVSYNHHKSVITDSDISLKTVLNDWISAHAELLLFRESYKSAYCIDWTCIQCKTKLSIDVHDMIKYQKPIDARAFYCHKCRPAKMTISIMTNPILIRYINTFYAHVKLIIRKNTNTELTL